VAEQSLAWLFVRHRLIADRPVSLKDCVSALLPPGFTFPVSLQDVMLDIHAASSVQETESSTVHASFLKSLAHDRYLLWRIPNQAGPDIAFFGHRQKNGERVLCFGQVKAQVITDPNDGLRTVNSGLVYMTNPQRDIILEKTDANAVDETAWDGFRHLRRAYQDAVMQLQRRGAISSVRFIFNVAGFSDEMRRTVLEYNNSPLGAQSPILLLQSSAAAFGENGHELLLRSCTRESGGEPNRRLDPRFLQFVSVAEARHTEDAHTELVLRKCLLEAKVEQAVVNECVPKLLNAGICVSDLRKGTARPSNIPEEVWRQICNTF